MSNNHSENTACVIGFNDKLVWMVGLPIIGILLPIVFFNVNPLENLDNYIKMVLVSTVNVFVFWRVQRWMLIVIRTFIPLHKDYLKRLVVQIITFSFITYVLGYFSCWATSLIPDGFQNNNVTYSQIYLASYTVSILILTLYESMYFFDLWKIGLLENEKLKTANSKAQLTILKNQVNPHFLFNSLNTLASVIPEDPKLAVLFVEKLSAVYRYVLEYKNKELISLDEELKCIASFEFLLKIRFGDKLMIEQTIAPSNLSKYIVPMSLQIIIENAVKHNVVSTKDPLTIKIYTENNTIIIENNIKLKTHVQDSTKTGLNNIRDRYQLIRDKKVTWTDRNDVFKVEIPLIEVGSY